MQWCTTVAGGFYLSINVLFVLWWNIVGSGIQRKEESGGMELDVCGAEASGAR
jgi:hypothetical protein